MVCFMSRELAEQLHDFGSFAGGGQIGIEKVPGLNTEVFANAEEACHGRECTPVFDFVDIAFTLPKGKTHVPGRDPFFNAQLCKPLGKPLTVIHRITSYAYYNSIHHNLQGIKFLT